MGEHLGRGVLHVPSPKGGTEKAYDLPLCQPLLRELDCLPQSSEWVFPGRKSYMSYLRRGRVDINPHSLRRLYRTVAVECEIDLTLTKVLLNHALANDISFRYVSRAHLMPAMRKASEKIAERLLSYRE